MNLLIVIVALVGIVAAGLILELVQIPFFRFWKNLKISYRLLILVSLVLVAFVGVYVPSHQYQSSPSSTNASIATPTTPLETHDIPTTPISTPEIPPSPAEMPLHATTPKSAPATTPGLTPTPTPPSPTPTEEKQGIFAVDIRYGRGSDHVEKYAEGKGWQTIQLDVEPLTFEYLTKERVSILLISDVWELPYKDEELRSIYEFVDAGGGLLVEGNYGKSESVVGPGYDYSYSDEVTRMFGVRITDERIGEVSINVTSSHALMEGLGSFYLRTTLWEGPVYLDCTPPSFPVLEDSRIMPQPIICAAEVGKGRVVVYPANFPLTLLKDDNNQFLCNVLRWLQE